MPTKKSPQSNPADDLNDEAPVVGKRLVVRFKGEDFEIEDIAHDRPWREVVGIMASAGGERGIAPMEPAMLELLGADQLAKTDEWNFADFMQFSQKVGERIGASIGQPGESSGSRR